MATERHPAQRVVGHQWTDSTTIALEANSHTASVLDKTDLRKNRRAHWHDRILGPGRNSPVRRQPLVLMRACVTAFCG